MSNIAALIERLEQATEGSRELDGDIAETLELQKNKAPRMHGIGGGAAFALSAGHCWIAPRYTTSIDAALTLLPEWASCELTRSAAGPPTFTRAVLWDWRRSPTGFDPGNEWRAEGNRSLPMNICIAALRARQGEPR